MSEQRKRIHNNNIKEKSPTLKKEEKTHEKLKEEKESLQKNYTKAQAKKNNNFH